MHVNVFPPSCLISRSPDIPPNSSLVYDLELLEIKSPLDFSSISEKELLIHL